jgi:hypothetical protein
MVLRMPSRAAGAIAEINPDKFGCVTPGTAIPIVSEAEARAMNPDYFLVLPWHSGTASYGASMTF